MTKAEKLLQKIRRNPRAVSFHDLDKILLAHGFERRQPRGGSSHYVYSQGQHRITVPYKRPFVKQYYAKDVLKILDELDADSN